MSNKSKVQMLYLSKYCEWESQELSVLEKNFKDGQKRSKNGRNNPIKKQK